MRSTTVVFLRVAILVVPIALGVLALRVAGTYRPPPSPAEKCMTGLSYAALAILKYSSDHNDVVSDTTVELIPYLREEHFEVFNSGLLCCPESGAEFRLVSGLTMSSDPNSLLAYCPTAHSWESKTDVGYNVLFVDSTIRSLSQEDFMQQIVKQNVEFSPARSFR